MQETLLSASQDSPLVQAECMRLARRLLATGGRVFGFLPADEKVAVPPVCLQIAAAIAEHTDSNVGFVDANVRYPALLDMKSTMQTDMFSLSWVRKHLGVLSPTMTHQAGEVVPALARLLLEGGAMFHYLLVDLTGFELIGEHASAAACMDSVLLLALAHRTREKSVIRWLDDIPADRFFGVLVVG